MKFIPPLEITSKIMSLIEEAQKEIIIVSPYVNIQKWGKMKSCIERAIERGVATKNKINTTDKEIDAMVYALYGLTEEEIAIVESSN